MLAKSRISLPLLTCSLVLGVGIALWAQDTNNMTPGGIPQAEPMVDPAPAGEADDPNVEVTTAELTQLLGLPPSADLREYQIDLNNPTNLFANNENIERIFGTSPRFIYLPEGTDPMIIPWVRRRIIAEQMLEDATIAAANRDYELALQLLNRIREEAPNTEPAEKAPAEIARIERLRRQGAGEATPTPTVDRTGPSEEEVTLPQWVADNTTGILLGTSPVVVVGNDFLRTGEPVPRFPNVRVKTITQSEVVYTYRDKEFNVEVDGSF